MRTVYPILISEIAKRGIKKNAIAARIGVSERCLYNKLYGISSFTWEEVCAIVDCFFPDMAGRKDELFARAEDQGA